MKFLVSALLVALTSARSIKEDHMVFAQMEKSPFGSTLLSFVAMNLKIKSPVDEINLVIDQIVQKVQDEQDTAETKKASDDARCSSNIAMLTKAIAETKTSISNTETFITEKEAILAQAQAILKQAKSDYAETISSIESGMASRTSEHTQWESNDAEANVEIVTLEQGVRLVQHMLHGVTFAQIQTKYNDVVAKLSNKNSKHAILFRPLVSQLVQVSTQLNFDNVQKVLDLLNSIRQGIVDARAQAKSEEDIAQSDWEKLLKTLSDQKFRLQTKIKAKELLITMTQQQLKDARAKLATLNLALEDYIEDLKEENEYCDDAESTYQTETAERTAELEILEGLQKHIDENITGVATYVEANAL